MKSGLMVTTALLTTLLNGYALADDDCREPVSDWQPRDTLRQQVEQHYGWTVQRIKVDDGCYKLRGADSKGNAIEARYSPASLTLRSLQIEFSDSGDARDYLPSLLGD